MAASRTVLKSTVQTSKTSMCFSLRKDAGKTREKMIADCRSILADKSRNHVVGHVSN